ncbi:MAG: hypothetical protein WCO42_09600 [bacterium]
MTTKRQQQTSLAFFKFKLALTAEIHTAHYCWTAFEYSSRWWKEQLKTANYGLTTDFPGDSGRPFSSIAVSPTTFIGARREQSEAAVRGNAIINIHTAFETYLSDTTQRAVFLKPMLIKDSGLQIEAGELARVIDTGNVRRYLADLVAEKYLYNKSHKEMVQWIDRQFKCGIENGEKTLFTSWKHWSDIRNALIHAGREVSQQLVSIWPERFGTRKPSPKLDNCDVVSCHTTAYRLAAAMDRQIVRVAVGDQDASLLARELFVRHGITDSGELSRIVDHALSARYSKSKVEHSLALQRRTTADPCKEFDFTDEMLQPTVEVVEPSP